LATIVRPPAVETAMLSELARRGFVEGRNLILERRVGPPERLPDMARELVESHPDVILAVGLVPARAARAATQSVPIIAVSSFPVEAGLVANLDGAKVYVEFPHGIGQGVMPPLFIIGSEGKTSDLVNYRVRGNHMIVDRLFAAAELRLGDGGSERRVRIVRTDGTGFWQAISKVLN
jgi:hypothetical protein